MTYETLLYILFTPCWVRLPELSSVQKFDSGWVVSGNGASVLGGPGWGSLSGLERCQGLLEADPTKYNV